MLADYLPWTEVVRIPEPPPKTPACRDPHDVKFLQLALAAKADALVSGDADLFELAPLPRLAILAANSAVKQLSA